jgi:urea transport system ATP-binding protein
LLDKAFTKVSSLSHGQKQWIEIGMVLAQDPTVVLLDEPQPV